MRPFNKPVQNNTYHIETWKKRGLIINCDDIDRYLNFISYYRLSAYTIPFQKPIPIGYTKTHEFIHNITFDNILNLYVFDRELRLLILDAIDRVEIAIRSQVCNVLCMQSSNPFWYTDEKYFDQSYSCKRLLAGIEKQLLEEKQRLQRDEKNINERKISSDEKEILKSRVRKENFLRHYLSKYNSPKLPPSWMMIEMLTWGELSHLYSGLKLIQAKKKIAQNMGLHAEVMESWLKTLNDVRNICAHHGRLWNKEFGRSIKIPTSNSILWLKSSFSLKNPTIRYEKRIYSVIVALQVLLYKISPHSKWAQRFKQLLDKYPQVSKEHMGIPENWYKDIFWLEALK